MRIINIIDKEIAAKLKSRGFSYGKIKIDGQSVFQFVETDEIKTLISENFAYANYFLSDTMNFTAGRVVKN